MKQNPLLSLFALRNSQMRQYSDSVFQWYRLCTCNPSGYTNSPTKKEWGCWTAKVILFFCLSEREGVLWEVGFKLCKDATEARNWLTQSLWDQQRCRQSTLQGQKLCLGMISDFLFKKNRRGEIAVKRTFLEFTFTSMSNSHVLNHLAIDKQSPGLFSLTYRVSERIILLQKANISLARTALFQEPDAKCTQITGGYPCPDHQQPNIPMVSKIS